MPKLLHTFCCCVVRPNAKSSYKSIFNLKKNDLKNFFIKILFYLLLASDQNDTNNIDADIISSIITQVFLIY